MPVWTNILWKLIKVVALGGRAGQGQERGKVKIYFLLYILLHGLTHWNWTRIAFANKKGGKKNHRTLVEPPLLPIPLKLVSDRGPKFPGAPASGAVHRPAHRPRRPRNSPSSRRSWHYRPPFQWLAACLCARTGMSSQGRRLSGCPEGGCVGKRMKYFRQKIKLST